MLDNAFVDSIKWQSIKALSAENCTDYEILKNTTLVLQAYQQKFRNLRKSEGQTGFCEIKRLLQPVVQFQKCEGKL